MSEGVVRKIQPFTIGTRLSVPPEAKSQEFVDVNLHRSAAPNKLEQQNNVHDQVSLFRSQSQPGIGNSEFRQVAPRVDASTQEGIQDESVEEDRNSVSPTASSRSIRKIAICRNAEMVQNVSLCDLTNPVKSMLETNQKTDCVHPNLLSMKIEENLEKRSNSQSKVDFWYERTLPNWKHGCSYLGGPLPDREVMSPTEKRDLKDTEYSFIQLTSDLSVKQDGHQYETLEVEPDSKEEKRERLHQPESNAVGSRASANQTCFQSLLENYQHDLRLALDVSSFYQQADNIICTINRKRSVQSKSDDQGSYSQMEINNIASQIMMLNQTVSRLSGLHPILAARVTWKQAEVQKSWGLLREARRSNWPDLPTTPARDFSCDKAKPVSQTRDTQGTTEHKAQVMMGKDIKEEQNHLTGFKNMKDVQVTRELTVSQVEKQHPKSYAQVSCNNTSNLDDLTRRCVATERKEQTTYLNTCSQGCQSELSGHLQKSTTSADKTLSWLKDNLAMTNRCHRSASLGVAVVASKVPAVMHEDNDVSNRTRLDVFEREMPVSIEGQHQCDVVMEDLLGQVETLWEVLRRRHQRRLTDANSSEIRNLEQSLCGATDHQKCMNDPMGELLGVVDDLGEAVEGGGHSLFQSQDTRNLMSQHLTLILRINQLLSRCAELSMDILHTEADMAVRCAPDISGLKGLHEQQDELEIDYRFISEEVEEMERLASRLQLLLPDKASALEEDIQTTQQAWEELGCSMAENRCHLQQFRQLQDFLMDYLAMISWTEDIQVLILEASTQQWSLVEPSELDLTLQQKFGEFEKLAAAGQKLIKEQHHLSDIIKERTEELQSMMGWIMVHWRAQKDQLVRDKLKDSIRSEVPKAETTNHSQCQPQNLISLAEPNKYLQCPLLEHKTMAGSWVEESQKLGSQIDGTPKRVELCHREPNFAKLVNVSPHIPPAVAVNSPRIVLEKPCATVAPLGSSINLILSFDQQPPGGSMLQGPLMQREAVEPAHRVGTYLQVPGGSPVFEDVTSPNITDTTHVFSTSSKGSACSTFTPKISTVLLSNLAKTRSTTTLNLTGAMKRRKKMTHRHTVTGIFGMPKPENDPTNSIHRANTWPPEDNKESYAVEGSSVNTELQLYIKNKHFMNVRQHGLNEMKNPRKDEKLYNIIPLGSTLSFDLPKNWGRNLQISANDLTTDKGSLAAIRDLVSPNSTPLNCISPTGSKLPGQTPESLKVIGRTFAISPKEGYLKVDRELDSPNGSHSNQYRQPGSNTVSLTHKVIGQTFTLSPGEESTSESARPKGSSLKLNKMSGSNIFSQTCNMIGHTLSLSSKAEQSCDIATKDSPKVSSESISLLLQSVSLSENIGAGLNSIVKSPVLGAGHNNNSSSTIGINDNPKVEISVPLAIFDSTEHCNEPICSNSMIHNLTHIEPSESHNCLSVHTKVRDLNGHIYFPSTKRQFTFQSDLQVAEIKSLSNVSEDSTRARRSGRVIVCSEENCCVCSDSPTPVMVTAKETSSMRKTEPIHPDHWQFEEEEEELEDIWNGTDRERAP